MDHTSPTAELGSAGPPPNIFSDTSPLEAPSDVKYRGIEWDKCVQKWRARITIKGKKISLGSFHHVSDAARAYNEAVLLKGGAHMHLNKGLGDVDFQCDPPVRLMPSYLSDATKTQLLEILEGKSPVPARKMPEDHKKSPFRGVTWDRREKKWRARITIGGKHKAIGRYMNQLEAALSYDNRALELLGPSARLNFKAHVKQCIVNNYSAGRLDHVLHDNDALKKLIDSEEASVEQLVQWRPGDGLPSLDGLSPTAHQDMQYSRGNASSFGSGSLGHSDTADNGSSPSPGSQNLNFFPEGFYSDVPLLVLPSQSQPMGMAWERSSPPDLPGPSEQPPQKVVSADRLQGAAGNRSRPAQRSISLPQSMFASLMDMEPSEVHAPPPERSSRAPPQQLTGTAVARQASAPEVEQDALKVVLQVSGDVVKVALEPNPEAGEAALLTPHATSDQHGAARLPQPMEVEVKSEAPTPPRRQSATARATTGRGDRRSSVGARTAPQPYFPLSGAPLSPPAVVPSRRGGRRMPRSASDDKLAQKWRRGGASPAHQPAFGLHSGGGSGSILQGLDVGAGPKGVTDSARWVSSGHGRDTAGSGRTPSALPYDLKRKSTADTQAAQAELYSPSGSGRSRQLPLSSPSGGHLGDGGSSGSLSLPGGIDGACAGPLPASQPMALPSMMRACYSSPALNQLVKYEPQAQGGQTGVAGGNLYPSTLAAQVPGLSRPGMYPGEELGGPAGGIRVPAGYMHASLAQTHPLLPPGMPSLSPAALQLHQLQLQQQHQQVVQQQRALMQEQLRHQQMQRHLEQQMQQQALLHGVAQYPPAGSGGVGAGVYAHVQNWGDLIPSSHGVSESAMLPQHISNLHISEQQTQFGGPGGNPAAAGVAMPGMQLPYYSMGMTAPVYNPAALQVASSVGDSNNNSSSGMGLQMYNAGGGLPSWAAGSQLDMAKCGAGGGDLSRTPMDQGSTAVDWGGSMAAKRMKLDSAMDTLAKDQSSLQGVGPYAPMQGACLPAVGGMLPLGVSHDGGSMPGLGLGAVGQGVGLGASLGSGALLGLRDSAPTFGLGPSGLGPGTSAALLMRSPSLPAPSQLAGSFPLPQGAGAGAAVRPLFSSGGGPGGIQAGIRGVSESGMACGLGGGPRPLPGFAEGLESLVPGGGVGATGIWLDGVGMPDGGVSNGGPTLPGQAQQQLGFPWG